ncbi:MAG: hypothetical protein ICV79_24140, partial [Flavisolibacter sp.]|nr:hypothetical protein [Flavisolibacter sp.]
FFLLLTCTSLLIPSHIRISKAIDIMGNKDSILLLIENRESWPEWHPAFQQKDASIQKDVTIQPIVQNDSVVQMQVKKGNNPPIINGWQIYSFPATDSLTLQWYMDFHLSWYPWQKFSSLLYEKTYGVMMERGLQNIKTKVEGNRE